MVERIRVFKVEIDNRPGSLHSVLSAMAGAGIDLACLGAASMDGGKCAMFVVPKDAEKAKAFAEQMGVEAIEMAGFITMGEDKMGAGAEAIKPLADAGINGVFCMAICIRDEYAMLIIVNQEDSDAAGKAYGL